MRETRPSGSMSGPWKPSRHPPATAPRLDSTARRARLSLPPEIRTLPNLKEKGKRIILDLYGPLCPLPSVRTWSEFARVQRARISPFLRSFMPVSKMRRGIGLCRAKRATDGRQCGCESTL